MLATVIFLHRQSYISFKILLILLHKVSMPLHSLLEGDEGLFNRIVVEKV